MINLGALYSLFIESIFQSTFLAFACNPLFLLPSLGLNYLIATEYSIMFYARRSMCINLYLKQNGKQIIAETYGGEYRTINIKDIYKFEVVRSRLRQSDRLQINHGANQFLFFKGNSQFMDSEVFDAIIQKRFVDTKNIQYDIDVGKSYTWEIDALMRSNMNKSHKKKRFNYLNPLGDYSNLSKIQQMKMIGSISTQLRKSTIFKSLNHNAYHTYRMYHKLKLWSDFNKAKLQGSTIKFTKDLGDLKTKTVFPPPGYDKEKYEKRDSKQQEFENVRRKMFRRPKLAKA